MKLRIQRIEPASLAATLAVVYFIVSLFLAGLALLAALAGGQFTLHGPLGFSGAGASLLALALVYPVLAAFVGAISGFLLAWMFNLSTRVTQGLVIECSQTDPPYA